MQHLVSCAVVLLALPLAAQGAESGKSATVPEAFPVARYEPMKLKSPFVLATAVVKEETPPFAQNLFISGLAKLGGKEIVTVTTADKKSFTLMPGDERDGIRLSSVNWSDEIGKTKVTLQKGTEFGIIGFNEMAIRSPAPGAGAPPVPPQGGVQPPGANRPPGSPQQMRVPPPASFDDGRTPRRRIIRRPSQ